MSIKKELKIVEKIRQEETEINENGSSEKLNNEQLENFEMDDLEQVDAQHKNVSVSIKGSGCLTVINHGKCGRRIHLSNVIWRELECPRYLNVYFKDKRIILTAGHLFGIAVKFDRTVPFEEAVEKYTGKVILYATETVKRITTEWQLDFEKNCCYTGGVYKRCTVDGKPAILILKDEIVEETIVKTEITKNVEN